MPQIKRDAVHRYYVFDASSNCSKCNICGNNVKGKHTSNLKNHLSVKHIKTFNEVQKLNKHRIMQENKKKIIKNIEERKENNGKNHNIDEVVKKLKILCMQLITVHGRPLDLISDEPFQKLLHLAASSDARSNEIDEDAIKAMIPDLASDIKTKISAEIHQKLISLKVDIAIYLGRRFLGINIQYIKKDKIVLRNLSVIEVNGPLKDDSLKNKFLEVLNEFKISKEQIYSLTVDNCTNMKRMTRNCSEESMFTDKAIIVIEQIFLNEDKDSEDESYEEKYEVTERSKNFEHSDHVMFENFLNSDDERDFKVRGTLCPAHILHLAIKDAIDDNVEMQSILELAKKIFEIMHLPANSNLLKLVTLQLPKIDCATGGLSKYNMLVRLHVLREFCENLRAVAELVTPEFWLNLGNLVYCLEPFNECNLILQKEQLTIGDFFINWMKCITKVGSIPHSFASSLKKAIELREKSLFELDIVLEGLYLDGRLNILLSEKQCQKAIDLINQTWKQIQRLKQSTYDTSSENLQIVIKTDREQPSSSKTEESTNPILSDLSAIEDILVRAEMTRGLSRTTKTSFNAYLHEIRIMSRLPLDTNIILHWSEKSAINSDIKIVADTILATPVTQVSLERLFSSLEFMLNASRSNLSPNLLQNILLIRSNKDLLQEDFL